MPYSRSLITSPPLPIPFPDPYRGLYWRWVSGECELISPERQRLLMISTKSWIVLNDNSTESFLMGVECGLLIGAPTPIYTSFSTQGLASHQSSEKAGLP